MSEDLVRDRNFSCMSFWFPRLACAPKVTVPDTLIYQTSEHISIESPDSVAFVKKISANVKAMTGAVGGIPCFLRTGHTSNKHQWSNTCYLDDDAKIEEMVFNLIEFSETVDILGLPTNVWAVRELIPLKRLCFAYEGMPVCREFRFFIDKGDIRCFHPYWPKEAIRLGKPKPNDWMDRYDEMFTLTPNERCETFVIAGSVAAAFADTGVGWSLDLAQHEDGRWYAIDMAVASISWHDPECKP